MHEDQLEHLSVTIVQTDLFWEDITANLSSLEEKIAAFSEPTDVIILPEMFNTGFTMNTSVAEHMNLTTTKWMKYIAYQTGALIIGSFAVNDGGHFYNRLVCMKPDGSYIYNDKRHLFTMGQEHRSYTAGTVRNICTWKGWKICPLICYDLRFPVWSRNAAADPYDLLVYVANWPAKRTHAWSTLLKARAIENQSYVAGVNRVGQDGNGEVYRGNSVALDYLGEPLFMLGESETEKTIRFSKTDLQNYRSSFPALSDADPFHFSW